MDSGVRSALRSFGVLALLGACAPAARPVPPRVPPAPASARASAPSAVSMPGPGPHVRRDAEAANRACEGCHEDVARDWRGSLHARSFVDPVFARAFEREPARFCRDCHAPEDREALGVACVTCHDPSGRGEILAAPLATAARATAARATPPHPVRRTADFAGTKACAGCHEFPFPDVEARGHDGARMQRTVEEHAASRFADRACASCHMPRNDGVRSHGFTPDLGAALVARATRAGAHVVVDLAPGTIGHAFPTGDLFRRLLVVGEVVDDDWQLVARAERPLSRHFRFERGVQREIADDRVRGPVRVELDLGDRAKGHDVVWRVEYQRVAMARGEEVDVASRVVVAEGRLHEEP